MYRRRPVSLFYFSIIRAALVCVFFTSHPLNAAIRPETRNLPTTVGLGVLTGGKADQEFSIIGMQVRPSIGSEQLIITYGDHLGMPRLGEPGFYHVVLDHGSKRIVIDLAQVSRTAVDQKELGRILAASTLVEGTDMTMDPLDASTNITLKLRVPVELTVRSDAKKGARLIIDMRVVGAGSGR